MIDLTPEQEKWNELVEDAVRALHDRCATYDDEAILHAEARIRHLGARVQELDAQWVSVEDRLPPRRGGLPRSKPVQVYTPSSECQYTATWNFNDEYWELFGAYPTRIEMFVSHWAELRQEPSHD